MKTTTYIFRKSLRQLSEMLLYLGGYDPRLVEMLPLHYKIRLTAPGLSMVIGGILAWFGGAHTAFDYSGSILVSVLFGFIWSFIIMTFDFSVVVTLSKNNKIGVAILRIISSFIFSLLISLPLILMMYKESIKNEIDDNSKKKISIIESNYQTKKYNSIDQPLKSAARLADSLEQLYLAEISGESKTNRVGIGQIAIEKLAFLNRARQQETDIESRSKKAAMALRADRDSEIEKVSVSRDELGQLKALFKLTEDPSVLIRCILVTVGLILLEIGPLLIKLTTSPGPYDTLLKAWEEENLITKQQRIDELKVKNQLGAEVSQLKNEQELNSLRLSNLAVEIFKVTSLIKEVIVSGHLAKEELRKDHGNSYGGEAMRIIDEMTREQVRTLSGLIKKTSTEEELLDEYKVCFSTEVQEHPFRLNAAMFRLARKFCLQNENQRSRLEAFYNWTIENIPYDKNHNQYGEGYRNAENVFYDRMGVCGEMTAFFVAVSRAMGLSASYVSVTRDYEDRAVNHAAAQVILHDGSSYLIDIAYGQFNALHKAFERVPDEEVVARFKTWRQTKAA